ncbi:MAG: PAS domain S-box protein [Draconibacterium sp.]
MGFSRKSTEDLFAELQSLQQKYDVVLNLYEEKLKESLHTEQSLIKREADIQAIIENSLDSIWSIDTNYNIQYINNIFKDSFNQSFGVQLTKGLNILEALPEELRPIWKERYDRAFNNEHFIFEDRIDLQNSSIYIEVAMNPVIINGKVAGASFFGKDITKRKRTEEALRENEEIFSHFMENSPVYVFFKDKNINALRLSRNYEEMLGRPLDEIIGKPMTDLFPAEIASKMVDDDKRILQNGKTEIIEEKLNGRHFTTIKFPININNKPKYLAGYTIDITDRKKTEDSLLKSEYAMKKASENWNRTFQAMHSGIALLDKEQHIIQSNRAFQQFFNTTENELAHNHLFVLIPELESGDSNPFCLMKKSRICQKGEIELKNRIFEVIFDPVTDENGAITGAVFIMNDVTQRKRDEKIQHILYEITGNPAYGKSLSELLIVVRKELSKVIDTTNFFVALHNTTSGKLRKVIFKDEKDDFIEWDANKSLSGQVLKHGTALLLNSRDEARFAVENNIELLGSPAACWLGVPIMQAEKTIGVMVVQSYTDENAYDTSTIRLLKLIAHELSVVIERKKMIEDLVAAKEKAEESDRLKSAFLANVSHEIRTPMNGILGFADLLKQPELTGEELHHFIGIIEKSGERMLNIINDLINISKIESGQMDINTTETNINEQIEFLYNFFLPEAKQKKIELNHTCPLPVSRSFITTDREKLYAILTNLIKNALKFTPSGSISFGYQLSENKVLFYVKDTGIGIPLNKQKTIFERFVQANSDHKSRFEGAGLGLAISKAYVEMLGGKIWIESEEGKGTSFYFTLPTTCVSKREKDGEIEAKLWYNDLSESAKAVLIADDDEISMLYMKRMLEEFNVELFEAKNGAEAVEICRKHPEISLVLMDINMPELNGFEASKQIKKFRPELTMIAQTAYALEHDIENYKDPFDGYITKPIKTDEIKQIICNELYNCQNS